MDVGMTKGRKPTSGDQPARRKHSSRVGELLPDIGRVSFRRFGFVQSSIISRWPEIVGARYAQVSAPESIRFPKGQRADGVLTLVVEPAHAAMLQHVVPDIIERTNRFFGYGAVARITLKQDRIAMVRPERASPPSLRSIPVSLGNGLRTIADPELRACLESLAGAVAASAGSPVFDEPVVIGQKADQGASDPPRQG